MSLFYFYIKQTKGPQTTAKQGDIQQQQQLFYIILYNLILNKIKQNNPYNNGNNNGN